MTLAEKILARASGRERVWPDQIVVARVDLAMSHENADLVRKSFLEIGLARVWDPSKIVIVFDHRIPAESERTATTQKAVREFRGGAGHRAFLRRGARRHLPPGAAGKRARLARHGAGGNGFAHHHARRVWGLRHGHRRHEMAGVWAEGALWFKVPSTLRIEVEGEFRQWVSAKDLILYIIGKLGRMAPIIARWSSTDPPSGA